VLPRAGRVLHEVAGGVVGVVLLGRAAHGCHPADRVQLVAACTGELVDDLGRVAVRTVRVVPALGQLRTPPGLHGQRLRPQPRVAVPGLHSALTPSCRSVSRPAAS